MPIFQALEIFSSDVAMTYKKYFYHCGFSSFIALICRVLRGLKFAERLLKISQIGQNGAKCGVLMP